VKKPLNPVSLKLTILSGNPLHDPDIVSCEIAFALSASLFHLGDLADIIASYFSSCVGCGYVV
jgi:hypothetical protein